MSRYNFPALPQPLTPAPQFASSRQSGHTAAPQFANRAERDAYYRAKYMAKHGQPTEPAAPQPAADPGCLTLDVPASLVTLLRFLVGAYSLAARIVKLIWFVFAAMMATILAGMLIGILSA